VRRLRLFRRSEQDLVALDVKNGGI
jgi:hypothetical protein